MKNVRKVVLAAVVAAGAMTATPANAQGLWVGSWGWGGPVAFGPAPAFYGFGPTYVSTFRTVSWGYPGFYAPAYVAPVYRPVYAGPVYGGPVYAPRAHAIRVANRVARRNWRWGYGWGW